MRWRRVVMGVGVLILIPVVAEAHVIGGSSSWLDELVCLVPSVVLLAAVFLLGRDDKSGSSKKGKP